MTRQQTIDTIKALGLRCSFRDGEFRIAPNLGPLPMGRGAQALQCEREEAGAYYTNDKEDALGTAKLMAALSEGLK